MKRVSVLEELKKQVYEANMELPRRGLITYTWGNVSGIDRKSGYFVIKPSGVDYDDLKPEDMVVMDLEGNKIEGAYKPSSDTATHLELYRKSPHIGAVIHTHSTYSVLWSFVPCETEQDCIPAHTPYLKMKLGTVGLIPYEKPGSEALFSALRERISLSDGYLLKNHGPVVPGKTIMDAFYSLEELEESARIAWELYRAGLA